MSDVPFDGDDEANTPLTPEEREQLIPAYISFRSELNQAEQANIADGSRWFTLRKRDVLDQLLLIELHKRMFGQVWRSAVSYRTTARNIGINAYRIQIEMGQAVDDARYWVEAEAYSPDEIAVRFSHRVVAIHPFPNGNGRFSRLVGDMLAIQLGQPAFAWGRANLVDVNETRRRYVAALKAAEAYDIGPLLAFARS
jgi:Fic-DOC domain mobile mystery protein B